MEKQENDILEREVYSEKIDKDFFLKWLELNDNIKGVFISRHEFNEKKGEFLEENGENKYTLYLPSDLKYKELPSIIFRVNKITFGKNLPEYASSNELKVKIVILIDSLFDELKNENKIKNRKKLRKIIIKYLRLYQQLSSIKETQKLSDNEYRRQIIEKNSNNKKFKQFGEQLIGIETKEKLELFNEELEKHTNESFFERGIHELSGLRMKTFIKDEYIKLESELKNGKISDEQLGLHQVYKELDEIERPLREKIEINKYKKELEELRKIGNKEEIEKKELEVTNKILKIIYEYPWQKKDSLGGYLPLRIINSKELICVGFSLLGHSLLQELGIKHNAISISEHSALEINIGNKKYYFDGTKSPNIIEFKYEKINDYIGNIKIVENNLIKDIGYPGIVEEVLQSQILYNLGSYYEKLGEYKKALEYYSKALKINSNNYQILNSIGVLYSELGNEKEAIKYYFKALKIYPKNYQVLNNIGIFYNKSGEYEKALEYYFKALKINSKNYYLLYNIGNLYLELGEYKKALEYYSKALKINSKNYELLNNMGNLYSKLGKEEDAIEYYKKSLNANSGKYEVWYNISKSYNNLGNSKIGLICSYIASKIKGNYLLFKGFLIKKEIKYKIDFYIKERRYDFLKNYIYSLEYNSII